VSASRQNACRAHFAWQNRALAGFSRMCCWASTAGALEQAASPSARSRCISHCALVGPCLYESYAQ
jgi:hypothetical protein